MANALYDKGRGHFLDADIDWTADNIKVLLVSAGYVANMATDEFHAIIGGGNIVATSANLGTKTSTAGVADAADITFSAVTGAAVTQVVIYKDSGVSATSALIARIDTGTGLPVTPNGGDITISWDNGASKIFKL